MSRMLLGGLTALLIAPSHGAPESIPPLSQVWFKPTLQEDHAPICAELLQAAERAFVGTDASLQALKMPSLQEVEPRKFSQRREDGSSIHFGIYTHPGCGGGCEQYQIVAGATPLDYHPSVADGQLDLAPERSSSIPRLFVGSSQQLLNISDDSGPSSPAKNLYLHKVDANLGWTPVCQVQMAPTRDTATLPAKLAPALQALDRLADSMGGLSGGYGDCGSLRAGERRASRLPEDLWQALYRPWMLYAHNDGYRNPQSEFQAAERALEQWALTGIVEFRTVREYRKALEQAYRALAEFYSAAFKWSDEQSRSIARSTLNSAVDHALAFPSSGYAPFPEGEQSLRQAILEGRPIEEIRQIGGTLSDLSIAIEHPQAMQLLLEQGADPDQTNPFGKTPLMYAAQYNQLETARLLLAAGANANAMTILPDDSCTYTLHTSKMTALHYAVRYASVELTELLLQKGAVPFIRSVSTAYQEGRTGTPQEWLRRHSAIDAKEPNPHLSTAQASMLEQALRTPSPKQLKQQARQLTLKAEKDYAEGRNLPAYHALLLAREVLPQDGRILSNLSLVAFKLGQHGPALEAGQQLFDSNLDAKLLANAWFNQGLVCERAGWTSYNGRTYCRSGSVYAYYRAASLGSAPARTDKLLAQFHAANKVHCRVTYGEEEVDVLVQDDFRSTGSGPWISQTLYALYPSAIHVPAGDVSWQIKDRTIQPREVGTLELGEWRLSVLESHESLGSAPLQVGGASCVALRQ